MIEQKASRSGHSVRVLWIGGLIVAGFLALALLPDPLARQIVRDDVTTVADVWHHTVVDGLSRGDLAVLPGALTAADSQFLTNYLETADFFRMHLMDATGRVIWSADPAEIGEALASPTLLRSLADGLPGFALNEPADYHVGGEAAGGPKALVDTAEIFLPLTHDGHIIGAINFTVDVTAEYAAYLARFRSQAVLLAGLALAGLSMAALVLLNRLRHRQIAAAEDLARVERGHAAEQMRLTREVRLLGELNEWLQSSKSLDELFSMVARFMDHILTASSGSLYVYSNSRDVLDGAVSWAGGCHQAHIHPEDCWGLRRGRTYAFGSSEVDFTCAHVTSNAPDPYFCMPILAHGETVGLMTLTARPGVAQSMFEEQRRIAQMSAEQVSLAIANVRMRDALQHQAIRDPLTGLFNRRHMMDTLRRLTETRARSGWSLISIDVDHFKAFNDNHGHDAGDMVLRAVGEVLTLACDGDVIACRMGGEELMLLLPGVSMADAMDRAEQLRVDIAALSVTYGDKTLPRITVSIGVAHSADYGRVPQDVIRAADEALYLAKANGRNQVVAATTAAQQSASGRAGGSVQDQAQRDRGAAGDTRPGRITAPPLPSGSGRSLSAVTAESDPVPITGEVTSAPSPAAAFVTLPHKSVPAAPSNGHMAHPPENAALFAPGSPG